MKKVYWMAGFSTLVAALAFAGCGTARPSRTGHGEDGGGGTGGDPTGSSSSSSSGSDSSSASSSSGSGSSSSGSSSSSSSSSSNGSSSSSSSSSSSASSASSSASSSSGTMALCNPVTNAGCDGAAGEACDATSANDFQCFGPPNDALVCDTCDNTNGPFCMATLTCRGGGGTTCVRYCCTNADCGAGHTCTKGDFAAFGQPNLGICDDAACTPPANAPSGGSCVNGP